MKKIVFAAVFLIMATTGFFAWAGHFSGIGRGQGLTSVLWTMDKEQVLKTLALGDKTEVFCVEELSPNRFIIGGVTQSRGTIWIIEKNKIIFMEHLPEANVIYSLLKARDGRVWAVGSHKFLGACAWVGTEKGGFRISSVLHKGSVAYAICEGKDGSLFAGGIFYTHGKVWMYHNGNWNRGDILTDSRQINTLCADHEGTIYASGQKIRYGEDSSGHGTVHQGGVWTFTGEKWGPGIDVPSSVDIYCSAVDQQGKVWLGGAGEANTNRTLWVLEKPLWKPMTLENCLALYALNLDRENGDMMTTGWNKQLRGRIWLKEKGRDWSSGKDIDNCFIIRGLVSSVKAE